MSEVQANWRKMSVVHGGWPGESGIRLLFFQLDINPKQTDRSFNSPCLLAV